MRSLAVLVSGLVVLGLIFWCALLFQSREPVERLSLRPAEWRSLTGWQKDDPREAFGAFQRSCEAIRKAAPNEPMGGVTEIYGLVSDWLEVCSDASASAPGNAEETRHWFEEHFAPFAAANAGKREGLFTGYYEPELEGSLAESPVYATALLKRPGDLVTVDLGAFRDTLKGQRIAGRVVEGRLRPFESRAEIGAGALDAQALALAWAKDPVAAFFLQIQGSGRVRLAEGGVLRLGYDGQNGHPYTPIGRVLRQMGALGKNNISMRTIKDWLAAHPEDADMAMDHNASYVFFKPLDLADPSLGPLGAEGVPLTPGRSLAVDRKFHALGVPLWLETSLPKDEAGTPSDTFRRLMIAQDTGGAITGPVRGDVFFGFGPEAETLAGRMKQSGRFYVLLPKTLAARLQ